MRSDTSTLPTPRDHSAPLHSTPLHSTPLRYTHYNRIITIRGPHFGGFNDALWHAAYWCFTLSAQPLVCFPNRLVEIHSQSHEYDKGKSFTQQLLKRFGCEIEVGIANVKIQYRISQRKRLKYFETNRFCLLTFDYTTSTCTMLIFEVTLD